MNVLNHKALILHKYIIFNLVNDGTSADCNPFWFYKSLNLVRRHINLNAHWLLVTLPPPLLRSHATIHGADPPLSFGVVTTRRCDLSSSITKLRGRSGH